MRPNFEPKSALIQSLQAAARAEQSSTSMLTPSGQWQEIRRHGSSDVLASKARDYIQGLLRNRS